ncbi:MAG: serine/threonine protein kinase [Planctomycetaceae bacterium]
MKLETHIKPRQKLGKYRIERKLANGGFAVVYQAMDTIEGIRVALKVPHTSNVDDSLLREFRHEVRMTAKLDHPNILPLKNASFIDDRFVIVFPLGEKSLDERLRSRLSMHTALYYAEQLIEAVAYAHRQRIIHCDIKPENVILFGGNRLRLTDFGIAKVALRTVRASGTGTVGYMAPEQAMGKPSLRSDVFSLGLVLYRMFAGEWPEWPYEWPPAGYHRLRGRVHQELIAFLRKAIEVNPKDRFRDGDQMLTAFRKVKSKALHHESARQRRRQRAATTRRNSGSKSR